MQQRQEGHYDSIEALARNDHESQTCTRGCAICEREVHELELCSGDCSRCNDLDRYQVDITLSETASEVGAVSGF
jgi:hypothetical protein